MRLEHDACHLIHDHAPFNFEERHNRKEKKRLKLTARAKEVITEQWTK